MAPVTITTLCWLLKEGMTIVDDLSEYVLKLVMHQQPNIRFQLATFTAVQGVSNKEAPVVMITPQHVTLKATGNVDLQAR
jgi:hypothetical protein